MQLRSLVAALLIGQACSFLLNPLPTPAPLQRASRAAVGGLRMQERGKKKVVIVGAGPAGILSAHYLLKRGKYDVTLTEMRNDPRKGTAPSRRSYSLGLGVRGRGAIKGLGEDLWEAVKKKGVMSERFCLHLGKRVLDIRQKSTPLLKTEPSCLINRADLCSALLEELDVAHGGGGSLQTHFQTACEGVDLSAKSVTLQGVGKVSYDLLIGADGVNSVVRDALLAHDTSIKYAAAPLNGTQKILHQKMPACLDPNAVHAMSGSVEVAEGTKERVGFFWVPERNSTTREQQACILVNWDEASAPRSLLAMEDAKEVQEYLNMAFPNLEGGVTLDAAHQFLEQRATVNTVNKLSCYADEQAALILMGDAAHSSGGASGQGCNTALQDAQVLDAVLGEAGDDVARAAKLFSERRVREGHALLDLSINQSPRNPLLRALFLLWSAGETFGHRLLPSVVTPPTQNMLTQTDLPFAEIYAKKKAVNDFIKASNSKYGVFTGYD
mmetsp:Transcript_10872/g.26626  ORF Transcript_10872/g.26626 Transcript_10872/m.26626 type:complete len:497 (-) Transcript_10872:597-2087(-)